MAKKIVQKKTDKYVKIITIVLLIAGVCILLYPAISNWLSVRNHSKVIKNYIDTTESMSNNEIENEWVRAREYNELLSELEFQSPFIPESEFAKLEEYTSILNINGTIGYIEIPVINVYLPIYHGTDKNVLQKGVGHLSTTAFPIGGINNHAALTGHSGLPSSELFTNLDKVKEEDLFYIHVLDEILAYKVISIKVVEPDDISDLQPVEGKDYITLITCTPYGINSHRLLIKAERTPYIEENITTTSIKHNKDTNILIISIIILLVLLIVVCIKKAISKKKKNGGENDKKTNII